MTEQFEDRDLSDSVFWGVNLQRAMFRDADLSGARFFHTLWSDVSIDGVVQRLVVNGVDVTDHVNRHDRWYPLRTQLEPTSAHDLCAAWATLQAEWSALIARATAGAPDVATRSMNGEWSLRDTLRHLLFAIEKWFGVPVLGQQAYTSFALPNTGSQGLAWPGIDLAADPDLAEVLAARADRIDQFTRHIEALDIDSLPAIYEVPENGPVPALMCFHVVLEEEFEHLRYAMRDLDAMGAAV